MSTSAQLDADTASAFIDEVWEQEIVPELTEYIRIPAKSPAFDPDWAAHGYIDQAVEQIAAWCEKREIHGLSVEVVRLEGRTPVIFMEIPGTGDDTVLLYGHLDKQPEMVGWRADLGPWTPKREGDRLYGRGGADDGYAAYASLTAIEALQRQGMDHARCVVLIEACEESGSFDLPYYLEYLNDRVGTPSLVVCLDSGCGNYEQLWATTSLRGIVVGTLTVRILDEGVHSGDASGVVPSSFRIARMLISRMEDEETGSLDDPAFEAEIPEARRRQAEIAGAVLGDMTHAKFPFAGDGRAVDGSPESLVLNRTWRAALSVTGAGGLPDIADAGNVLRPETSLKLSLRVPPTTDAGAAFERMKQILERDPPYGATVSFEGDGADGWEAPLVAPWLAQSIERASQTYFGAAAMYMGEGGSIPFMAMLGDAYPEAQFLITGVLGPASNAHGPNEFLHIPTGRRVTACVAEVLADHRER